MNEKKEKKNLYGYNLSSGSCIEIDIKKTSDFSNNILKDFFIFPTKKGKIDLTLTKNIFREKRNLGARDFLHWVKKNTYESAKEIDDEISTLYDDIFIKRKMKKI